MSDGIRARLDAMQARAEAATEGPWEAEHRGDLDWLSQSPVVDSNDHEPGSVVTVAGASDPIWASVWPSRNARADAEFIAAARQDLPALLGFARDVLDLADRWEHLSDKIPASNYTRTVELAAARDLRTLATRHLGGEA